MALLRKVQRFTRPAGHGSRRDPRAFADHRVHNIFSREKDRDTRLASVGQLDTPHKAGPQYGRAWHFAYAFGLELARILDGTFGPAITKSPIHSYFRFE